MFDCVVGIKAILNRAGLRTNRLDKVNLDTAHTPTPSYLDLLTVFSIVGLAGAQYMVMARREQGWLFARASPGVVQDCRGYTFIVTGQLTPAKQNAKPSH